MRPVPRKKSDEPRLAELRSENRKLKRKVSRLQRQVEELTAQPEEVAAEGQAPQEDVCPVCGARNLTRVTLPSGKTVTGCKTCKKLRGQP